MQTSKSKTVTMLGEHQEGQGSVWKKPRCVKAYFLYQWILMLDKSSHWLWSSILRQWPEETQL